MSGRREMSASDLSRPEPIAMDWSGTLQSLSATIVIAVFVITFILQAFQIPSPSMENTLLVGDYLLVDKLCYGDGLRNPVMPYRKIGRGDIVVFHFPVDPKQHFVKRVIGLPGDRLRLVHKRLVIDSVPVAEPYVRFSRPADDPFRDDFPQLGALTSEVRGDWWVQMHKLVEDGQLIVPEGHYFVMGDNRDDSDDSRYWGFVPRENIIGRPLLIYWSVKNVEADMAPASVRDKLYQYAYALTHLFQITRWGRTLRLVN